MNDTDFFDDDLMHKRGGTRPARESGASANYDEIPARPVSDLNLTRMGKRREENNARVVGVINELEHLNRRQSDLEREKQAIEEINRKQADYERGRSELQERLNQSMVTLEKQEIRAARLAEIYAGTRKRFAELLKEVEIIKDETWSDANFREELSRAVAVIENVRKEYNKALATVEASGGEQAPMLEAPAVTPKAEGLLPTGPGGFVTWLKIGLALVLPLSVLMLVVGIIAYVMAHSR